MFENGGAGKPALLKAADEAADTSVVLIGGAGEQGQVAVGITPVLMKMEMDNRNRAIELIDEAEIIIARGGAKVGVAHIEANADHIAAANQTAEFREEFVEVVRAGMDRVFDGKFQPAGSRDWKEWEDGSSESGDALFGMQVEDQDAGSKVLSQFHFAGQQRCGLRQQRVDGQASVNGEAHLSNCGGFPDAGTHLRCEVLIVPTGAVGFSVRKPFESLEATGERVVEWFGER